MNQNIVDQYYTDQEGSGISVYRGANYQKGHGVGSFLSGLFKAALPLIKSGARTIGREALTTGINLLQDISQNKNAKESVKHRLHEAGENLKRKAVDKLNRMSGSGLKRRKRVRKHHLPINLRRKKTPVKKTRDIFN